MLKVFFAVFPALVYGHAFMNNPIPRIGVSTGGLGSPKLAPYSMYKRAITTCGEKTPGITLTEEGRTQPSPGNGQRWVRGATPPANLRVTTPVFYVGQKREISWDVRLSHVQPKNHIRIAYRYYTKNGATTTTTSQFADNVLENFEDPSSNGASPVAAKYLPNSVRKLNITIPAGRAAGLAELQWMWSSEKDGAGGFYISCADIIIKTGTKPPTGPPTKAPTKAPPPTPAGAVTKPPTTTTTFSCYHTNRFGDFKTNCNGYGVESQLRCMTTWTNGKYYYRCSNLAICTFVQNSAPGEGMKTLMKCCATANCNTKDIIVLPPSGAVSNFSFNIALFLMAVFSLLV